MPSNTDPSAEQAFGEKDASNLLNDYQILSQKYDDILKISEKILREITQGKDETKLSLLLDRKLKIGQNIDLLSRKIASRDIKPSPSHKSVLDEAKRQIEKIRTKVIKLWELERKIKELAENS